MTLVLTIVYRARKIIVTIATRGRVVIIAKMRYVKDAKRQKYAKAAEKVYEEVFLVW